MLKNKRRRARDSLPSLLRGLLLRSLETERPRRVGPQLIAVRLALLLLRRRLDLNLRSLNRAERRARTHRQPVPNGHQPLLPRRRRRRELPERERRQRRHRVQSITGRRRYRRRHRDVHLGRERPGRVHRRRSLRRRRDIAPRSLEARGARVRRGSLRPSRGELSGGGLPHRDAVARRRRGGGERVFAAGSLKRVAARETVVVGNPPGGDGPAKVRGGPRGPLERRAPAHPFRRRRRLGSDGDGVVVVHRIALGESAGVDVLGEERSLRRIRRREAVHRRRRQRMRGDSRTGRSPGDAADAPVARRRRVVVVVAAAAAPGGAVAGSTLEDPRRHGRGGRSSRPAPARPGSRPPRPIVRTRRVPPAAGSPRAAVTAAVTAAGDEAPGPRRGSRAESRSLLPFAIRPPRRAARRLAPLGVLGASRRVRGSAFRIRDSPRRAPGRRPLLVELPFESIAFLLGGGDSVLELGDGDAGVRHLGRLRVLRRPSELDARDARGEVERRHRLARASLGGGHVHEDESLAASTERALQQRGELAVAVGHVRRPLLQRRHHVAQGAEALVDVLRLLEPVAGGFRTRHPFAARQVHEVEHPARASARVFRDPLHVDDDGAVAAGRSLVHRGGARRAVHLALEHHLGDVPPTAHRAGHRARHVEPSLLRGQNLNLVTADRGEQIPALLVVNLQHGHGHLVRVRGTALLYEVEEIVQGAIVDTARVVSRLGSGWSRHRVRLTRARLTVRHEAHVVPVARASDQRAALLVNSTLRRIRSEDAVKAKRLALGDAALVERSDGDALRRGVLEVGDGVSGNLHDVPLAAVRARKVRPDSAEDAYGTLEVLDGVVKVSILGESLVVKRGSRRELLHGLHQRELLPRELPPLHLERGV
mmetsp:Transcript_2773/g.11878  ORF Transcript_2773/g.11878 Transcript_2773/m.11878 type:complete len:879 (+) Transcript_2773:562-3198(+)